MATNFSTDVNAIQYDSGWQWGRQGQAATVTYSIDWGAQSSASEIRESARQYSLSSGLELVEVSGGSRSLANIVFTTSADAGSASSSVWTSFSYNSAGRQFAKVGINPTVAAQGGDRHDWAVDYGFGRALGLTDAHGSYGSALTQDDTTMSNRLGAGGYQTERTLLDTRALVDMYGYDRDVTVTSGYAQGGDGADRLQVAYWGSGSGLLDGGAGHDYLVGAYGADRLFGGAGHDRVDAGGGNDVAYGGTGDDLIDGMDGNDSLYGDQGADTVRGGNGDDRLWGGGENDLLDGGYGNDFAWGGDGSDSMLGGFGNDALYGEIGNDTLQGGDGNDTLWGGDNSDVLIGGNGNDVLVGGAGVDWLQGGAGADIFSVANAGDGSRDVIADFNPWQGDRLYTGGTPTTVTDLGADTLVEIGYRGAVYSSVLLQGFDDSSRVYDYIVYTGV